MVRCCGNSLPVKLRQAQTLTSFKSGYSGLYSRNSWNCFTLFIFIDIILFELLVSFLMYCISIMVLGYN